MKTIICNKQKQGSLSLASVSNISPIFIDASDWSGVRRAAKDLSQDFDRVTGKVADLHIYEGSCFDSDERAPPPINSAIIVGTLGKNPLIDRLAGRGLLDSSFLSSHPESYIIKVIDAPDSGIERALVIAGGDKRGTIFGIYEISAQIGVSPWYWWSDVPARKESFLFADPKIVLAEAPAVRYRGIFLNDEYPALTKWVHKKYGTATVRDDPPVPEGIANYGSEFYVKIFELLLRLKANYLWPAMWNNAFYEDDPNNAHLADEFGIIMGTSHQEPMLRAQKEWDRRFSKSLGHWNYAKHSDKLEPFWKEGLQRSRDYEKIVTIGLRGADDTEMAPGGPEDNMALLSHIIEKQRAIISEVTQKPPQETPQLWCLYKEIQEYWEEGMRVPDDITLLWSDDNWGNQRRLPTPEERKRSGGAGIYYHFDYHGGPRSYQWTNTITVAKIWDQMTLAREYGADRIWIVNVGHFKGYEYPLSFFMNLAWNPDQYNGDNLDSYTRSWTTTLFGSAYALEAADILEETARINSIRKPELLSGETWSLVNYNEGERILSRWRALEQRANSFIEAVPESTRDAAFQIILYPVKASAILCDLYISAGRNELYSKQGRHSETLKAKERVSILFTEFQNLANYYNEEFAEGKWAHFMDQAVLGYTGWADPPYNNIDHITLFEAASVGSPHMGVAIEGKPESLKIRGKEPNESLPLFDRFTKNQHWIDVFNKSLGEFTFTALASHPWIIISEKEGIIIEGKRIFVSIDWKKAPQGRASGTIKIQGTNKIINIAVSILNPCDEEVKDIKGFVETGHVLVIEAEHFTKNVRFENNGWTLIKGFGKTLSGMRACGALSSSRVNTEEPTRNFEMPYLEYRTWFFHTGEAHLILRLSPSLNFIPGTDVSIGVSLDEGNPQILVLVPKEYQVTNGNEDWEQSVIENERQVFAVMKIFNPGPHVIRVFMISPGLVLERITIDLGGLRPSCLGPPESWNAGS